MFGRRAFNVTDVSTQQTLNIPWRELPMFNCAGGVGNFLLLQIVGLCPAN